MQTKTIHSIVSATPELYAVRAFYDKSINPQIQFKLVLFWASVLLREDGGDPWISDVVPVFSEYIHNTIDVDIDLQIMGFASREQISSSRKAGGWNEAKDQEYWFKQAPSFLSNLKDQYPNLRLD